MSNHLKTAHDYGVQRALEAAGYKSAADVQQDAEALGLIHKTANRGAAVGGALLGPVGAAIGAPDGHRMSAAGGALLGEMGGAAAGGIGGTAIGALLGLLAHNPGLGANIGGALGAFGGATAGGAYGGRRGSE